MASPRYRSQRRRLLELLHRCRSNASPRPSTPHTPLHDPYTIPQPTPCPTHTPPPLTPHNDPSHQVTSYLRRGPLLSQPAPTPPPLPKPPPLSPNPHQPPPLPPPPPHDPPPPPPPPPSPSDPPSPPPPPPPPPLSFLWRVKAVGPRSTRPRRMCYHERSSGANCSGMHDLARPPPPTPLRDHATPRTPPRNTPKPHTPPPPPACGLVPQFGNKT